MRFAATHPKAIGTSQVLRLAPMCFAIALLFCLAAPAGASGRPPGGNITDPVVRQVDIAAPAVVRIATTFTGTLTFNFCGVATPVGGSATLGATGSGAFITSNGDILTADHVVNISKDDLDSEWFSSPDLATAIAALLNAHASCLQLAGVVTANDILDGFVQFEGIPYTTQYSPPTYRVWMSTSYSGSISSSTSDSFLTSLLSATSLTATLGRSSTFENDDVALLHVSATDTPFIPLGDSSDVAVQDHLTVLGFPGNGDFFHPDGTYDPTDLLTPSLNTLYVSAIKSGVTGDTLLQVGGNIEHGDSGGPALNAAGQIVGVVSYSGTDTPVGTFFLRTSNDAMVIAKQAGLNFQPGQLEKQWTQAFDDYASSASGHWHTAARELSSLQTSYPAFRGLTKYSDYATQAAGTENATSSSTSRALVIGVIGVAALLILILVVVLILVLRRGRSKPPAYATYPSYSPYSQSIAPGGTLMPPYTPMQMPTSAEMVDLTRQPNGAQRPPSPFSAPLSSTGPGTNGAPAPVAVGATPVTPAAPPYAGQYTPQPFAAPVAPSTGTQQATSPTSLGAMGTPAESTTPLQRPSASSFCVNGHAMPLNEVYCGICGAPRNAGVPGQ